MPGLTPIRFNHSCCSNPAFTKLSETNPVLFLNNNTPP